MTEKDCERNLELVRVRKRGKVRASVCERETETEKGRERKRMYKIKTPFSRLTQTRSILI